MPPVPTPRAVYLTLETLDLFIIDSRKITFEFLNGDIFDRVVPNQGDLRGGYQFTIYGNFTMIYRDTFELWWGEEDIFGSHVTYVDKYQINGIVPSSDEEKTVEIRIVWKKVNFQDINIFFIYTNEPKIEDCWPPMGPTIGGT